MRELVYVSDAKLAQFIDKRRSLAYTGEAELSVLGALKLKIMSTSPHGADGPNLPKVLTRIDRVLSHLDSSDNPPLWFEDDEVDSGRWVQFEARQCLLTTSKMLVSWNAHKGSPRLPNPLLVLHGSAHHALTNAQRQALPGSNAAQGSLLHSFLKQMRDLLPQVGDGSNIYSELYTHLRDVGMYAETAVLAGFARVTAAETLSLADEHTGGSREEHDDRRIVLASPLYVERV